MMKQNLINHIALVLDASGSMREISETVVTVADEQIKHLAKKSSELDQETRISVYSFSGRAAIRCLIYDKDVLRVPSIKTLYAATGKTALRDATQVAIQELQATATLHGDHAFLIYVLTDGEENDSHLSAAVLSKRIAQLPDNWTLAAFVPNREGRMAALDAGFSPDNISIWETDEKGMKDVGDVVRTTTDAYMHFRSQGMRGSKNLFKMGVVSKDAVKTILTPLHPGQYRIFDVSFDSPIAEFVEAALRRPYRSGEAYYQLMKPEEVQPQKNIILLHRKDHKLYVGKEARALLGLPDYTVKVAPEFNSDFTVFIQSTSVNRKLIGGTKLVVLS